MTISSTTSKVTYSGNGATTVFAYTFEILANTDILVQTKLTSTGVITTYTLGVDYTVSGVGASSGGNVTFTTAPATGTTVILSRDIDILQPLQLREYDPFPSESVETEFDRLTMICQQIDEEVDRSLKLDPAVSGYSAIIGTPTAGYVLRANSTSDGFEWASALNTTGYTFGVGTGILVQSISGTTAIVRTLTGTANEITVTNGSGVSGNPTISIPNATTFTGKTITGGTFASPTISGTVAGNFTFGGTVTFTNAPSLPSATYGINISGNAATVTTNANLTGVVTSVGNATSFASVAAHRVLANITGSTAAPIAVATSNFIQQVNKQYLTSSGTYTPTTGTIYCEIEIAGGGGGGGGCAASSAGQNALGGGGGGAGYTRKLFAIASIVGTAAITIGSGGNGGAAGNNNGSTGGTTTVVANGGSGSTLLSATGGSGGSGSGSGTPNIVGGGNGGSASSGDENVNGSNGGGSLGVSTAGNTGFGGSCGRFGITTGVPISSNAVAGTGGIGFGSGGAGGGSANGNAAQAGGNGKSGVVIITEYIAV